MTSVNTTVIIRFGKQRVTCKRRDTEDFTIKSCTRTDVIGERSGDRLKTTAQRITSNYFGPTEITALRSPDFTGGIVLRQLHIPRYTGEFERRDAAPNLGASRHVVKKKKKKQLLNASNHSAWHGIADHQFIMFLFKEKIVCLRDK